MEKYSRITEVVVRDSAVPGSPVFVTVNVFNKYSAAIRITVSCMLECDDKISNITFLKNTASVTPGQTYQFVGYFIMPSKEVRVRALCYYSGWIGTLYLDDEETVVVKVGAPTALQSDVLAILNLVTKLDDPASGLVALAALMAALGVDVSAVEGKLDDPVTGLAALEALVDTLEAALGNPTGDMSAVTQSETASLSAYLKNMREVYRAHDQTRICLIVPDLANIGSDAPNTAIKVELEKVGSVSLLDQTGVDGGQEDWSVYDLVVVGSNIYAAFVNANLDDLILLKVPVMVCNRNVAIYLKMGSTQTQSASDVNEYCETVDNRVMWLVFGSTGEKVLFTEATVSDRLNMSDPQLTEQVLMVDTTGDGNTKVVLGWLPMETPVGVTNQLDDGTDIPAGRAFCGCFVNADKLTALGQLLLQRFARNFTQASITPSISLKAQAAAVQAILNDTADMQPKLGAPAGVSISADIAAVKGETAAILAKTYTYQEQIPDTDFNLAAIDTILTANPPAADVENSVVDIDQVGGSTFVLRSLWVNVTSFGTGAKLIFKLWTLVNGVVTMVDSVDVASLGIQNLVDIFGLQEVHADGIWITVQTDAGNTGACAGSWRWAKAS